MSSWADGQKRLNAQENEGFAPFLKTLRSIFTTWHLTEDQKSDLCQKMVQIKGILHSFECISLLTCASHSPVACSRLSGFCLQKHLFAESLTYILIHHEAEPFGLWARTKST